MYDNLCKLALPLLTVALIEGDTLGGGFEAVLTNDVIIAERDSKFGLPAILFDMFPGGAYSLLCRRRDEALLCRRLDAARARQLILSGRLYEAEELEGGESEGAVHDYLACNERRLSWRVLVADGSGYAEVAIPGDCTLSSDGANVGSGKGALANIAGGLSSPRQRNTSVGESALYLANISSPRQRNTVLGVQAGDNMPRLAAAMS